MTIVKEKRDLVGVSAAPRLSSFNFLRSSRSIVVSEIQLEGELMERIKFHVRFDDRVDDYLKDYLSFLDPDHISIVEITVFMSEL